MIIKSLRDFGSGYGVVFSDRITVNGSEFWRMVSIGSLAFRTAGSMYRIKHPAAHIFIIGTHVQFDDRVIQNDIFLRPGLQGANGQNPTFQGRQFAGDNSLQAHNGRRGHTV